MQAEKLNEIGEQLRTERQQQNISIEEVAAKTYIPARLLRAIEAGQIDLLPEPVFIQGFIRRYGDLLGLDGIALSREFPVNASPADPLPNTLMASVVTPMTVSPTTIPALSLETASRETTPRETTLRSQPDAEPIETPQSVFNLSQLSPPAKPILAGVGALAGLGVLVLGFNACNRPKTVNSSEPAPPAASPANKTAVTGKPTPKSSIKPTATPAAAPTPTPSTAPGLTQVKLNLIEESWLEVSIDGTIAFEGNLPKGTQRSWSGKKVVVRAGNAGGVSASYNNGPAKILGTTGQVQDVTFPAQN